MIGAGHHLDAVDQAAKDRRGGVPGVVVGQGDVDLLDLAAIVRRDAGMQGNHGYGLDVGQLGGDRVASVPGLGEGRADLGEGIAAIGQCRDQAIDAGGGLPVLALESAARAGQLGGAALMLDMIFTHEGAHQIGVEHLFAQPAQHPFFQFGRQDRPTVAAGPFPVAATAPAIGADHDDATAAHAAADQAGEQALWPAGGFRAFAIVPAAEKLDGIEQITIDDRQFRHRLNDPFAFRIGADAGAAQRRVRRLAGAHVHQLADIEPVLQHAILAFAVARDRRCPPGPAARPGHAHLVQALGNGARTEAGGEKAEDSPHDLGLVIIDRAEPAHQLAMIVQAVRLSVAIGQPGRCPALPHRAALPAPDLRAEFLAEQRVGQALHHAGDLGDVAIVQGEKPRAGIIELLADIEAVAAMAGDAIGRLGQHLIDAARRDAIEQRVQAGTLPFLDAGGAADRVIGEDVDDRPAFALAALAADRDLILDRAAILERAAVAGVDDGPHGPSLRRRATKWILGLYAVQLNTFDSGSDARHALAQGGDRRAELGQIKRKAFQYRVRAGVMHLCHSRPLPESCATS